MSASVLPASLSLSLARVITLNHSNLRPVMTRLMIIIFLPRSWRRIWRRRSRLRRLSWALVPRVFNFKERDQPAGHRDCSMIDATSNKRNQKSSANFGIFELRFLIFFFFFDNFFVTNRANRRVVKRELYGWRMA